MVPKRWFVFCIVMTALITMVGTIIAVGAIEQKVVSVARASNPVVAISSLPIFPVVPITKNGILFNDSFAVGTNPTQSELQRTLNEYGSLCGEHEFHTGRSGRNIRFSCVLPGELTINGERTKNIFGWVRKVYDEQGGVRIEVLIDSPFKLEYTATYPQLTTFESFFR